jgi:hypothetical protein
MQLHICGMANARIESWLKSKRNFSEGISLFNEFSDNEILKDFFSLPKNSIIESRLSEELQKISDREDPAVEVEEKEWQVTDDEYIRLPDEGKQLQRNWKAWYAEMKYLQARLDDAGKDDDYRLQLALKIVDLDENIREAWRAISFWRKYGELPGKAKVDIELAQMPVPKLINRRNNLRTYLSRTSDTEENKEKITAWRNELNEIEKILGDAD